LTAKSIYNVANAANQVLLQAQADFCSLTETLINEFRAAQAPQEEPIIDQLHQAHAATKQTNLLDIIKELRDEVNSLKNKENVNPNARCYKQRTNLANKPLQTDLANKPWQYC